MAAETAAPPPARSSGGGFQRLVLWLLIFCLLGVVWWLASERNERHFRLAADNGYLIVERGRFFPMGTARIVAEDGTYGKAYGPLQLPPGAKVSDFDYDDQASLDRGLFDQMLPWAREAAKKGDVPAAQQQAQLTSLRGELAYSEARNELAQAAKLVLSARRKLEIVRDAAGEHALQAAPLASELGPVVDLLAAAAEGKRSHSSAADPAPPPAATPNPAPAPSPAPMVPKPAGTSAQSGQKK